MNRWLLALSATALLASPAAATDTCRMAGIWNLEEGVTGPMTIRTQNFNEVEATYEGTHGNADGTAAYREVDGELTWVVTGTFENSRYQTSGRFEWYFNEECTVFSGRWSNASGGATGEWSGTRIGDLPD